MAYMSAATRQWFSGTILNVLLILFGASLAGSYTTAEITAVVGSPAVLNCIHNTTLDIETVYWKKNSSGGMSFVYFPKDGIIEPPDHDPRYSISGETDLAISSVASTDNGNYICTIGSPGSDVLTNVVQVTVVAGCNMWNYTLPLISGDNCNPESIIYYQQRCLFSCTPGFHVIGEDATECQGTGALTGSLPHCNETTCQIVNLPLHVIEEGETCNNGSHINYGQTCTFTCEYGYILVGPTTVACLADGFISASLPSCSYVDPISGGEPGGLWGLLALIAIIPLLVMAAYICIRRRPIKGEGQGVQENEFPDVGIPLLASEIDNFPFLVNDQIEQLDLTEKRKVKATIVTIMRTVENNIIQDIPSMQTPIHECPANPTAEEAFIWYIYKIISFIGHREVADKVKKTIVTATNLLKSISSEDNQSVTSETAQPISENQNTIKYCEIVHEAFAKLLVIERSCMEEDIKRDRTARVAQMLQSYQYKFLPGHKVEVLPPDWKSSAVSGNSQENHRGHKYFADMCVKSINVCSTINEASVLRHEILNIIYS